MKKGKKNIPLLEEHKHEMLDIMIPFHTKLNNFDPFESYVSKHSSTTNKESKSIAFKNAMKERSIEQEKLPQL
jgi:hypothetical protein